MVRQVEKIWPPFITCAHCEVFQPPVLDRALSTFSRKKGVPRTHPVPGETKMCRRARLALLLHLAESQGRCQGKSITATQKRVADEDDQAGHSLGSSGLAHGPMAMRQLSSRATHCGTQPQYFLPQEGSLGLNF